MKSRPAVIRLNGRKLLTTGLLALLTPLCYADSIQTRKASLDEYRAHLVQLEQVVESCKASASACKPESVGLDDLVDVQGRVRRVDYGWLRDTLSGAADAGVAKDGTGKDAAKDKGLKAAEQKKTAAAALDAAVQRLRDDQAVLLSASAAAANDPQKTTVAKSQPVLRSVLASGEFHNVKQPSIWERALQTFFEWLDKRLRALGSGRGPTRNLVRLLVYGSILICLTLLVWWYARQIRQQRIALAASVRAPHPSAASAVDWQLRLQQAQALAAAGDWREAVHLIYWAAVSRLESLGNWPADRARTPREYLQLLPPSHRNKSDLTLLTRSFEGIWYGRRTAQQADFDGARSLLERLAAE